ncbi:TIGR03905 family TSCPD domain-containing protein [Agathobacter rectalis]|uniref:ribonucleoside-diphosphate reductase n=1 Tax=Agathobacter rectalis TaxID=39491 RepID=A0A413Q8A0_9FIRM|nr:TIGR03905 family TSCPD domain-containing protein [Agathobacter rectalis]
MSYIYKTKGTCSTQIELDLDGDVVHNVKFTGGCNGNLKAIPKLVEGLTVAQVEEKIGGIKCGFKNTSCGDQLAKACREAYEARSNEITSKIASVYKHVAPKALP